MTNQASSLRFKMSWLPEKRVPYTWWQSICLRIIRCGELPKHVAFIMDGNRRFAREKKSSKKLKAISMALKSLQKLFNGAMI